jgi:iron complex transport system ATP-binding protein
MHDLATAMNHADRVIVLSEDEFAGHVAADGAPEEALSVHNIKRVWGVDAQWIGEPGARALITY